jgi:hypothetical protein
MKEETLRKVFFGVSVISIGLMIIRNLFIIKWVFGDINAYNCDIFCPDFFYLTKELILSSIFLLISLIPLIFFVYSFFIKNKSERFRIKYYKIFSILNILLAFIFLFFFEILYCFLVNGGCWLYMPSACTIAAPLGCDEWRINGTENQVTLIIRNGYGMNVTINNVNISNCGNNDNSGAGFLVEDGTTQKVSINCNPELKSGKKFKGDIFVTYIKTKNGTINQTSTGYLFGKIL